MTRAAILGLGLICACRGEALPPARDAAMEVEVDREAVLRDPGHTEWSTEAPERFTVEVETSVGAFTLGLERALAPRGVDRFYNLVRLGYYDDARFHRVVPSFIVQWGLAGDPELSKIWMDRPIEDDPVVGSNVRGTIAFAFTEPGTRTTQVYVSVVDNSRLDEQGFAPLGRVVDGMDVVDRIYSSYGEESGGGVRRGDQSRIVEEGNAYLDREFPQLTRLIRASIGPPHQGDVPPADEGGASPADDQGRIQPVDTAAVTDWVESMMGRGQFPAAAVVIVDASGPLYVRTFGSSGTTQPLTADSRFYIGSSTKTMTALGVMWLVEQGLVELDAPLTRYLPELEFSDPDRAARLTIEHLLRHSSGLPRIAAFNRRVQETGRIDRIRFSAEPGETIEYSSLNFQLLGAVIEAVSGMPYAEFMATRIFEPAGMSRTSAVIEEAREGLVQGHTYFFGWPVARAEPRYAGRIIPTGYVITTPNDLARYLRLHLDDGGGLVRAETIESMLRPRSGETGVGLGWGVSRSGESGAANHAGMTQGFYSRLLLLPEEDLGVAVVTSRNAGPFLDAPTALLDGVVQVVRGEAPEPYFPWERIIRIVFLAIILSDFVRTGLLAKAWKAIDQPRAMAHTTRVIGRLVFDLTLAAAIPLWIILGLARLPIQSFFEFYPDLGIGLVLFPLLAIPAAVLRSLVTSEKWRREVYTTP